MPLKALGEFAQATESLEAGFEKSGQPVFFGTMAHDHNMYLNLTDTAMELRDVAAIEKYAPQLEQLAMRDEHKLYIGIAQRALGVALCVNEKYAEAETRLNQALDLFNAIGARWQQARTLIELAELNLAQPKKKAKAREYFSQALSAFEEMRATPNAEHIRARLAGLN